MILSFTALLNIEILIGKYIIIFDEVTVFAAIPLSRTDILSDCLKVEIRGFFIASSSSLEASQLILVGPMRKPRLKKGVERS